ncbi:MAG: Crp/Fnr family transcriptional regulator [Acidobacteria bacterium]|nr:Crp/Fnr family transcriptional regulator [Acidobacteriota bacterium]
MNLAPLLRAYPVLDHVPSASMARIEALAMLRQGSANQRLFAHGAPCREHAFLLDGTVRISRLRADGREATLHHVRPGDNCTVTALGLLSGGTYHADGTAESSVAFCVIPRALFIELLLDSDVFRASVFSSLTDHFARMMALVDEIAFQRVDERLAARLAEAGPAIAATHQMLAEELATSREVVSRILESFQRSGLIRLRRRRIDVLDLSALRAVGARRTQP